MSFAQDLKAVADADDEAAFVSEFHDALHNLREAGDRAAAQVVAVTEAARKHDALDAVERFILVPQYLRVLPQHLTQCVKRVVVIERSGETYDSPLHPPSTSQR